MVAGRSSKNANSGSVGKAYIDARECVQAGAFCVYQVVFC